MTGAAMARAESILERFGVDGAVAYTAAYRAWQLGAGLVTVLLVARWLSPVEQGVFFTFMSLVALQVVFELGLTTVVMQYASHEMAGLRWTAHGTLEGDRHALARLGALRAFAGRWFTGAAVLVLLVVTPIGAAVLASRPEVTEVPHWTGAWAVLVAATAVSLAAAPAFALLEGCGRVREVARVRAWQDVVAYGACWALLISGAGVTAYAALAATRAVISLAWTVMTAGKAWRALPRADGAILPAIRRELWPMQWRVALSWVSGFFIFQTFAPIAFMLAGAVAAGRLGMTVTIAATVTTLAGSWLAPKAPAFGRLIALGQLGELQALFRRTLSQALGSALLGAALLLGGALAVTRYAPAWRERVLEPNLVALLLVAAVANVAITGLATYLRAFKREPFLASSLAGAVLTPAVLLGGGYLAGVGGMVWGYTLLTVGVGLPWAVLIYRAERPRTFAAPLAADGAC